MTATATTPDSAPDTWTRQLKQLKARYKHVRPPILVALNILLRDKDITVDDAKSQAQLHGVRITAASVAAAQRLLSRRDDAPAAATKPAAAAPQRPARRARPTDTQFDAEALVLGVVSKLQARGDAELDRVREGVRRAIAILQAAAGS